LELIKDWFFGWSENEKLIVACGVWTVNHMMEMIKHELIFYKEKWYKNGKFYCVNIGKFFVWEECVSYDIGNKFVAGIYNR